MIIESTVYMEYDNRFVFTSKSTDMSCINSQDIHSKMFCMSQTSLYRSACFTFSRLLKILLKFPLAKIPYIALYAFTYYMIV